MKFNRVAVSQGFGARLVAAVLLSVIVAACGPGSNAERSNAGRDSAITVASFNFAESHILAELYAQALQSKGYRVERQLDLGPRELVQPALERGLVEFVPEYLGTALEFATRGTRAATGNAVTTHRRLADELSKRGLSVLSPSPAEDTNGIAVTRETAERYGLKKVSDLAPVAKELVFGGPPECPDRPLCLPGLEDKYGLVFQRFVPLDASGPITTAALAAGEVDVAVLFTTDPDIKAKDFVLLEDDLELQPAENVTPIVRQEVAQRYGTDFVRLVDSVSRRLTTTALAELNRLVDHHGRPPREVAAEWLRRSGVSV